MIRKTENGTDAAWRDGLVGTHARVPAYAANWATEEASFLPGSRAITLAPLSTSAGFVQLQHYTAQGCTLYMQSSFDAAETLQLIQDGAINCFGGVPFFFEAIAALPEFADADLSSLKMVTVGGWVSRQLQEARAAKGIVLRQIYGQAKVGGNATIMPEHIAMKAPEKCGWGGILMDLRVVHPDGGDCEPGEQGEILMRSPGMMVGYWDDPEEVAKTIREGWLYSGDIGMMDEDGLLTFVDRFKDLIFRAV